MVILRTYWSGFVIDKHEVISIRKTGSFDGHQWSSKKRGETKELWRQLLSATQGNTNMATSIVSCQQYVADRKSLNVRLLHSRLKQELKTKLKSSEVSCSFYATAAH